MRKQKVRTQHKGLDTRTIDVKPVQESEMVESFSMNTMDAFVNLMARMGAGTDNLTEGAEYPLTRLTKNYNLMNSLYRSHWLVRRIIDIIPQDMTKNWIKLTGEITPEAHKKFDRAVRRTQLKAKILEGLKWGRLYGGAAAIFMIAGQDDPDTMESPLDLNTIMPGTFKGLLIVDRWSGISPMLKLIDDVDDPEFGLPEKYQVTLSDGKTFIVHHSRMVRFIGRDLPFWEKQAETYWGASEVEHVFDEIKKRDNTSGNIASLIFLANIRVMKMADMGMMLSTGNEQTKQRVYNAMQAQAHLMSNTGMYVMDKEDDFDTKQYSFGGLSEVYELFMMDVAGAAEIPITKLFGRSPAGMNATGESDLQNYYDMIGENQEKDLRPILDKVLPVLMVSEFGGIADDFDYTFQPANTVSNEKKAELGSKLTTAIIEVFNAGIINQQLALKELKQMEETTGLWSNITEEDIKAADTMPKIPDMPIDFDGDDSDEEEQMATKEPNRELLPKDSGSSNRQNPPRDQR